MTRRDCLGVKNLTIAPVLVVEVLSTSTRSKDLVLKRETYQRHNVPSYWVIDPNAVSFTAYDLIEGGYRATATAHGDERVTLDLPFTVTVCPVDLMDGR